MKQRKQPPAREQRRPGGVFLPRGSLDPGEPGRRSKIADVGGGAATNCERVEGKEAKPDRKGSGTHAGPRPRPKSGPSGQSA